MKKLREIGTQAEWEMKKLREIGTQANWAIKPAGDLTNPLNHHLHIKAFLPASSANAANG